MPKVIWLKAGIPEGAVGMAAGVTEIVFDAEVTPDADTEDTVAVAPDTELAPETELAVVDAADAMELDAADEEDADAAKGAACLLCLGRFTSCALVTASTANKAVRA